MWLNYALMGSTIRFDVPEKGFGPGACDRRIGELDPLKLNFAYEY
jgi:hypothetical protein